jgi:hypothetical protein
MLLSERKRYRTALAFGLTSVLTFIMGCGGGSTGGGGAVPTTTKLTVASTKVPQGAVSFGVNVTSAGKAPSGSVQLFDGTSLLGAATALSGGSATISIPTLAVGTHCYQCALSGGCVYADFPERLAKRNHNRLHDLYCHGFAERVQWIADRHSYHKLAHRDVNWTDSSTFGQFTFGGKKIFQNCGAGERNSTGTREPS